MPCEQGRFIVQGNLACDYNASTCPASAYANHATAACTACMSGFFSTEGTVGRCPHDAASSYPAGTYAEAADEHGMNTGACLPCPADVGNRSAGAKGMGSCPYTAGTCVYETHEDRPLACTTRPAGFSADVLHRGSSCTKCYSGKFSATGRCKKGSAYPPARNANTPDPVVAHHRRHEPVRRGKIDVRHNPRWQTLLRRHSWAN